MLSKPEWGWTDFQLPGSKIYPLSYVSECTPINWLERAVVALKEDKDSFLVSGFMEANSMVCSVEKNQCKICVREDPLGWYDPEQLIGPMIETETTYSISMLEFCRNLVTDFSSCIDAWAEFDETLIHCPADEDEEKETKEQFEGNKKHIQEMLEELVSLIEMEDNK